MTLGGFVLAIASAPSDSVAVSALQEGMELVERNDAASAGWRAASEAFYQRAITRRPLDPQAWRSLGDLYVAWARPDDALLAYGEALRRGENPSHLDGGLARLYALMGDADRSLHYWTAHLVHHPQDRGARLNTVWTAIRLGDWQLARTALERLLLDEPDDPLVHGWLGLLRIGSDGADGLSHLQAAATDPSVGAFLEPVLTAERLASAVQDPAYRAALLGVAFLKLDVAELPKMWDRNASAYGVTTEALEKATAALAVRSLLAAVYYDPNYADALAYLGQAVDEMGWSGWAQAALRYAREIAPQSAVVLTLTGLYWDRRGEPALARRYFELAYDQDWNNVSLCLEIAATYAAEGEYTAAEAWLLIAVDIAPDDVRAWKMLAHYYLDSGIDVRESGLAAAKRVLELEPGNAEAHDLLGWAYLLMEEEGLARTSLEEALAIDPTLAWAHYHLGRLEARQGRSATASEHYRWAEYYDAQDQLAAQLQRAREELSPTMQNTP